MRRASLSSPPVFVLAERAGNRLTLGSDTGASAHIFILEEDIVRLLLLPDGTIKSPPSWAIAAGAADLREPGRDRLSVAGFDCPNYQLEVSDGMLTLETARIRVEIALNGFCCTWSQRDGESWRLMFEDRPTQSYEFGWWDGRVYHYAARKAGERYYGLGERTGALNRAGRRFRLTNVDPMGYDAEFSDPLYKSIPFLLIGDADGACHGAFYDTMSDVTFDLGCELDNYHGWYRYMVADSGDLDLYVIAGPDPAAVTRRFTWLTGEPALMPRWALGYSGSTMSYTDQPDAQARLAGFVAKLEEHDIGCGSFHLSSGYTSRGNKRYVFNWNRDKFPNPAGFVQSYRAAAVEVVPNIKPVLLRDHPRYAELANAGLFVADSEGKPIEGQFWDEIGSFIDFTNPRAAAWWREQVRTALLDFGIRATWNDNNEYGVWDARARFAFFGAPRPAAEARPLQSLLMTRASRAAQVAEEPDRRPYLVTRSGMTGIHRYAQTWSGDNRTEWKTVRYNTKMGLGLALSGISNSGHDVGGFAGPAPGPELFLRWLQAGILMPRFSIHSWNDDGSVNEPWMYPELIVPVRRLMALRQRLIPYLYDLLWRYHSQYEPVVRPTWLDFPTDPGAWIDGDDHLLGRDLLVALICDPAVTVRAVRPPAGADWIDVWTGMRMTGGVEVSLNAPLEGPPLLFARSGSAIPIDLSRGGFRPVQAASSEPFCRGLWLFPHAAEGEFEWSFYEDDGDSAGAHDIWRGSCRSSKEKISVSARRDGPGTFGDDRLIVLLPPGERRQLIVEGGSAQPIEFEGRRGVTLTVG